MVGRWIFLFEMAYFQGRNVSCRECTGFQFFNMNFDYLNFSQTIESDLWCFREVQSGTKNYLKTLQSPSTSELKTTFLLGRPIFSGYVSFREGNQLGAGILLNQGWILRSFGHILHLGLMSKLRNLPVLQDLLRIDFSRKNVLAEVSWNVEFHAFF